MTSLPTLPATAAAHALSPNAPLIHQDSLSRMLYAQDASVYQETPAGVAFPKDHAQLKTLVEMAANLGLSLIPRGAGTSLAGQCVGGGLVLDIGRHMNQILELDTTGMWVRVQPGVILDDLNRFLKPYGLFFGPDTSTSNRCMIAGMVGNNSCGSHSILYGTTRDHLLEMEVLFADGTTATISPWGPQEHQQHLQRDDALGQGLRALDEIVKTHGDLIRDRYPRPEVRRRNTGYAFDEIARMAPYTPDGPPFDLLRLLAGSEGTLGITTEIKLNLVRLPAHKAVVCAHFSSLEEALRATVIAVEHEPAAVELIDKRILDLAKENLEQERNRFFVQGDPEGMLVIEFYRDTLDALDEACAAVTQALQSRDLGYAFPRINPPRDKAVWELRKAGLGILMGVPGDVKPVTVVEDTAVAVDVLPEYIRDFADLMASYGTRCVYYAHASVGELHLRPELNIKDPEDAKKFLGIAHDVTELVKTYRGSLSGEHGDGRLRSPMIAQFYGEELTAAHKRLKEAFDPAGMLNPGKIVDPKPIEESWRFEPGEATPQVETLFNWDADLGLVRAVEKCNGAGACRKRAESGGTMCPSYMVTLDEKDSTRGRANVFRQLLRENEDPRRAMGDERLKEALDLCLSCKGCKSECPASVDMGRMKAEFLQHYHDQHGLPLASSLFAAYGKLSRLAALAPGLANWAMRFGPSRWVMGRALNLAPQRALPAFSKHTFAAHFATWKASLPTRKTPGLAPRPPIGLYIDPFTQYTEPELGMATVRVLWAAGYMPTVVPIADDGRTYLSKGAVRGAREVLEEAMRHAKTWMEAHPKAYVVGIEPSALLTFRDEAPDLVRGPLVAVAKEFAARCVLLDELVVNLHTLGQLSMPWQGNDRHLTLHGHCHQKALVGLSPTIRALEIAGYKVDALPTGCCGMAGSFGYEADHYDISMDIGELVLFPALRKLGAGAGIVAPGTSCRHQIKDGTGLEASHPAIWLDRALTGTASVSVG